MHIRGKDSQGPEYTEIKVDDKVLETVDHFKYLGSYKSADGTCIKDVKTRIAMGKQKMVQLNHIWKDRGIPNFLKLNIAIRL